MDFNKMTGEPSQQNPTSVFGFDLYPPPFAINWNQTNPFSNSTSSYNAPINSQNRMFTENAGLAFPTSTNTSLVSPLPNPTGTIPIDNNYSINQPSSGFSFGGTKPMQEVVHFPFETYTTVFGTRDIRCKRKTDSPPLQPVKQHITEEKMAEHMSKLHISSETISAKETHSSRMQRLYMCEEMRKLQTDTILPQSLLSRIQGPCTALVLWKPPTKLIPNLDESTESSGNKNKKATSNKLDDTSDEADMNEAPVNNMDLDSF